MRALPLKLSGPLLLEPVVHADERGFFLETYRQGTLSGLSISEEWVQDNHSRSARAVLRGLHFQPGMAKLVRCARGSILDVLVDLRRGSPTFGRWAAVELDDVAHRQLYCPDGFGHGFCVTSDVADVVYRCSAYYDPSSEATINYADPDLDIPWPAPSPIVSARDAGAPRLGEVADTLPFEFV